MRQKKKGIAKENYSRGQAVVTAAAALNYIASRSQRSVSSSFPRTHPQLQQRQPHSSNGVNL